MSSDKNKITAMFVLDVIGRPPEHLTTSLNNIIGELDKEQGVSVKVKDIKEPRLLDKSKGFYTTFAEVEVEVDEILYLAILLFKYMPAHIEIIEPEMLVLTNNGWNDVLNELVRRLHGYDEIARAMQMENYALKQKITEITGKQVITPLTPKSEIIPVQNQKEDSKSEKKKTRKVSKKKTAKKKPKKK